jgi:hypothetical protein
LVRIVADAFEVHAAIVILAGTQCRQEGVCRILSTPLTSRSWWIDGVVVLPDGARVSPSPGRTGGVVLGVAGFFVFVDGAGGHIGRGEAGLECPRPKEMSHRN